jgi:TolB protein
MKPKEKSIDRTGIYIALIGLIGTVIVSLISAYNTQIQILLPVSLTQTAQTQITYTPTFSGNTIFISPTTTPSIELPTATQVEMPTSSEWLVTVDHSCNGTYEIYTLNIDTASYERITNNLVDDGDSVLSPDGKRIAFFSERDGDREIYVMNIDGSDIKRLTYSFDWDGLPSWSPDGKKLAFTSWRDGLETIYIMNDDGTNLQMLTSSLLGDWMPSWSPDGKHITFASWIKEDVSEIFVVDADGDNRLQLTKLNAKSFGPKWSPDGKKITFYSDVGGVYDQVYLMNQNGSEIRKLTVGSPYHNAWSADSQMIVLYRINFGIYVMDINNLDFRLIRMMQSVCQ